MRDYLASLSTKQNRGTRTFQSNGTRLKLVHGRKGGEQQSRDRLDRERARQRVSQRHKMMRIVTQEWIVEFHESA